MTLDPQVARFVDLVRHSGVPQIHEGTVERGRAMNTGLCSLVAPGPVMSEVRELAIPGPAGGIPGRLYRATPDQAPGLVVYLHGGGWVLGDLDDYDAVCRALAIESCCDVVSVDYRRAPEHRFPAALEDACAAVRWVADELAGGRALVVGGDNAGGNLATVVSRRARDDDGPRIDFQLLVYPVTDHDFDRGSYREHGEPGYTISRSTVMWFWDHYVPDAAQRQDPSASPLRAADLSGLPPAHLVIAELDPLRDEGLAYAERLAAAGVPVSVDRYADVPHGFFTMVDYLPVGTEAVVSAGAAIRERLGARVA